LGIQHRLRQRLHPHGPLRVDSYRRKRHRGGGIVSVLDQGGNEGPNALGGFSISKSITIRAEGVDAGYPGFVGGTGSWISIEAGPSDVIVVEGLHFNGGGILYLTGAQVHVVNCVFSTNTVAGATGIKFQPSGVSKLSVTDTVITNIGNGTGGGIVIQPSQGGSAQVALERVTVNGNAFGIAADGTTSTAGINVTIADSMIANNARDGIVATTPGGGAPIGVTVQSTRLVNNNVGLHSAGIGVTVRASNSTIIGNSTGLNFSGGGALLTAGNNLVQANGVNGTFSGPVALQ
jgi:hypothetical protein